MTIAAKIPDTFSRRTVLTGGLATGFLLAFHLPVRAVNEPGRAAGLDRRQIRAERLHPHRQHWASTTLGDAPGRDGTRNLYRGGDDPRRRA